ncbi:MAG: glycosyltransferase [Patescibacteria group bacterium]
MKLLLIAPYFFEEHRWMISAYKTALNLSQKIKVVVLTVGEPSFEIINQNLSVYRMRDFFIPDPVNYSIVPGLLWSLKKVVKREKPDVFMVNKHMFFTSFSILFLRLMGKRVITAIDTFPGMNWQPKNRFVRVVMRIYARLIGLPLLKISNKVVLYHEGLVDLAKRHKLNYAVIHNGVDLALINRAQPSREIIREKDTVNVCYIGRLESIKGYYDYLAAAKMVIGERASANFYFIGSYKNKEQYVKKHSSKNIIFLGHRDDIYSLLKSMDIFVLPSYSEGLPNALMEAMASGLPSVASEVGGVKILIREGENGFLFKPGDQKELAEKLKKLINNAGLRQKFGQKAKEKIERDFNWRIITGQYLTLFNNYI